MTNANIRKLSLSMKFKNEYILYSANSIPVIVSNVKVELSG